MKKLRKDTMDMVLTGATMGIGAKVIGGAGGDASAMSTMSSQMPTLGTAVAGGALMRQTQGLIPKDFKKKTKL